MLFQTTGVVNWQVTEVFPSGTEPHVLRDTPVSQASLLGLFPDAFPLSQAGAAPFLRGRRWRGSSLCPQLGPSLPDGHFRYVVQVSSHAEHS